MSMSKAFAAALAAIGVAASGAARAQSPFGPDELEISQLREHIYMIRSAASGNITALVADDGVLLVDSKFEREHDRYMELLRTVTDQPVRFVVNTHVHSDHSQGNARLESIGATLVATESTRRRLAEGQSDGLPTITFDDHARIWFGGKPLDLYYFGRGHTDGDLVILSPEDGIVFTGDLFAGYAPNLRLIDYDNGGSLKEWSVTLERILALEFDVVIPGHSAPTDRAMLQQYLDETIRMQGLIREMHGAGRTAEDIQTALVNEFGQMAAGYFLPDIRSAIDELQ